MTYLLDTHILIWAITDDQKLLKHLKEEISNMDNDVYVSIASLWEISIKKSLGKLELKGSLKEIFESIELTQFKILPIDESHIMKVSELEFYHRDPFDRLLIAQSMVENFTIITKGEKFALYPVNIKWN
jgi:PIN domain nuclease of toxin-antitoxin system